MNYKFIATRLNGKVVTKYFKVFVLPADMVSFKCPEKVEKDGQGVWAGGGGVPGARRSPGRAAKARLPGSGLTGFQRPSAPPRRA